LRYRAGFRLLRVPKREAVETLFATISLAID
jgi:hypothetical protein